MNVYNHWLEKFNRQLSQILKFKFTIHTPNGCWPFVFLRSDGFMHRRKQIMKWLWQMIKSFFRKWQICASNANGLDPITIWLTKNAHLQIVVAHQWIIQARLNSLASYFFFFLQVSIKKKTKSTFAHGATQSCELLLAIRCRKTMLTTTKTTTTASAATH